MKKFKKFLAAFLTCMMLSSITAYARTVPMYINGTYVERSLETVNGCDMLPILDIAGELGYNCSASGSAARVYKGYTMYTFVIGQPYAFDQDGYYYYLDVTPRYINGKFMIPSNAIYDVFQKNYTWDYLTDTIFINSDYTYYWLINTPEYKIGKTKHTLVEGEWLFESSSGMDEHDTYMYFYNDGTCYYETWRTKAYGYYYITKENSAIAYFDIYYKSAGQKDYYYYYSTTDYFTLNASTLSWKSYES